MAEKFPKLKSQLNSEIKKVIKDSFGVDLDSEVLSPIVDFVFKRVFTADDWRSKKAFTHLLNSALNLQGDNQITELVIVNASIPVDRGKLKKPIFDIRVKFKNGEQAIIEMQLSGGYSFRKRSQFIISRAYSSQELSGAEYSALKKCCLICFLNFSLFKKPSRGLVKDYRFRDRQGRDLTDDETIIFISLPEAEKLLEKPVESLTGIEMWAIFLKYITDKGKSNIMGKILEREESIKVAANILYEISQDEEARIQYENEMLAELDARSWISDARREGREEGWEEGHEKGWEEGSEKGREEGRDEGHTEDARKMLAKGYDWDDIIEITGLSYKRLRKLALNGGAKGERP
ncbi:MAG: Rpn family recombination-promoting nuclease/putative transposase [Clostridiales bacterium]|jgi:predicted transposase/invertase (TIGR01784 family)|nr:Rpn family recombination-promoting nuclease/putative transposase [Clostridiales bacterium]